jgi:hemerythrin-like domain-containing protein
MKNIDKNYNSSNKREKENEVLYEFRNSCIQRVVKNIKNSCRRVVKGTV